MENNTKKLNCSDGGLNIVATIYIIRYICANMKEKTDKKDIYSILNISRQRVQRMIRGENFVLPQETRVQIAKRFNIDEIYLNRDGKIPQVGDLTNEDWKHFFLNRASDTAADTNKVEKVKTSMRRLLREVGGTVNMYPYDSAVYHIWYYFCYGKTFHAPSHLEVLGDALRNTPITEWKRLEDQRELEACKKELLKHANYISALLIIKEAEKN